MIRSMKFFKTGEPTDVLSFEDHELVPLEDIEVRVRVRYSNINYSDLVVVRGQYGYLLDLPAVAGAEGVGTIIATGKAVTEFAVGDRVTFHSSAGGAWAEEINLHQKHVVKVPEKMSDEVAAQFFTNPIAAVAMLDEANVQSGDTILVTAAGSSLGKLLIQFAQRRGIAVIAVTRTDDLTEYLLELGAIAVINSEKENLSIRVKELTDNQGVQFIFDAVSGKLANQLMYCMAEGGRYILIGALSAERIPLNSSLIIARNIIIDSFWAHRWYLNQYRVSPEQHRELRKKVIQDMADWDIQLPVDKIYPLSDTVEALRHFQQSGRAGKILISCT